jgi:hypothetical protein
MLAAALLLMVSAPAQGKELRRSMGTLRPLLMGDAYVAVADEASVFFYNPAGLAWMTETSVEAFSPQFTFNDPVKIALVDPDKFSEELDEINEDLENEQYGTLLGREFYTDITIRSPIVVFPDKGLALGLGEEALANLQILDNRVAPLVRVELFVDVVLAVGGFGRIGDTFSWGFTLKGINRRGVDKTYTPADFSAAAESENGFEDRQEWKDASGGVSFTRPALDLGAVWRLPFGEEWTPRVGISALNISGYDSDIGLTGPEFGPREVDTEPPQAGELPQINTIGFAMSPWWQGIRFTFSLDVVDYTRTALPGSDYVKRLRLGTEVGLYPHKDGTARLALLFGLNNGHFSYGALSRVWVFEVGFGVYTVELGDESGDNPDERTTFQLGVRF